MSEVKEKNIPLAIGLNFILPGLGYMYMGKVIVGIGALLLIVAMYFTTAIIYLFFTWVFMNAIMAIDMVILGNKRKKDVEGKLMAKCPQCAEMIMKEAKICKHCQTEQAPQPA